MLIVLPAMVTAVSLAGLAVLPAVRGNFLAPWAKPRAEVAVRSKMAVSARFISYSSLKVYNGGRASPDSPASLFQRLLRAQAQFLQKRGCLDAFRSRQAGCGLFHGLHVVGESAGDQTAPRAGEVHDTRA